MAGRGRENLAIYHKNRDLISIGAYPAGTNAAIDQAIRLHEPLNMFLRQSVQNGLGIAESWSQLSQTLAQHGGTTK